MKKKLLKIASMICLLVSVLFLGQTSAFADEVKPLHEYNFDSDSGNTVMDSGKNVLNGTCNTDAQYNIGYNGFGKSFYFGGHDQIYFKNLTLPLGAQSIRFKFKKSASTVAEKSEPIISTQPPLGSSSLIYIGIIGEDDKNQDNTMNEPLPGCLRILKLDTTVNFELQTPKSICDDQWHDILYIWDGTTNTNSVKLYVDDMTTPIAQATANSVDKGINNRGNFFLGFTQYYSINKTHMNLNGYLDNVLIYDSAIVPNSDTSSNLKATSGDSKVDLTWNAVTDVTSYTIKRSTTAGGPYTTIATGVTGTTYTDTDVTNGTKYYYVVTAIINGSEGWNSNEASATPIASGQSAGNKALLIITMVTGERKEYEMTMDKINDFIAWYNSKAASSPTYVIEKDYNKASFTSRKDYIAFDQISNFEVMEYNN